MKARRTDKLNSGNISILKSAQTLRRATVDWLMPGSFHISLINEYIYSKRTKYQLVEIADVSEIGRCLITDGSLQSSECDEYIYHEALVHPALTAHPDPKKVLMLGGGEGGTLREVLRHKSVEQAVVIDIDKELVSICIKYLGWDRGGFADPRTHLECTDGRAYVRKAIKEGTKFDAIIVDVSDPQMEHLSNRLFTREFYSLCSECLAEDGIFATQALAIYGVGDMDAPHATVHRTVAEVFPQVHSYSVFIPCYHIPWGFVVASKRKNTQIPSGDKLEKIIASRKIKGLRFYDSESQRHLFALPKHIRQFIGGWKKVATDRNPIVVHW